VIDLNPNIKVLLAVSPVRYLSDGLEMNHISKSVLTLACQHLKSTYDFVDYFPSYEIFMDELRDYKYYTKDLIHPNEISIDYVWEKFRGTYIDPESHAIIDKIEKIQKNLNHRPFNPKSENYRNLLQNTLTLIKSLGNKLDFENEIKFINIHLERAI
jgi:hypothetical protein